MYRVTRLNPVSWAKAFTLAWLIVAIIIGLFVLLPFAVFGSLGAVLSEDLRPLLIAVPAVLVGGLVGLAMAAVFVFLVALVQGTAFNWALGRMGGLQVDLALGPDYRAAATAAPAVAPVVAAAPEAAQLPPPVAAAPAVSAAAEPAELPPPAPAGTDQTGVPPAEPAADALVAAEPTVEDAGDGPNGPA